jgi:hypothetical protein
MTGPNSPTPASGLRALALGLILCAAALASAILAGLVWPGLMSFDSLLAFSESARGITNANWPPMHAYLISLAWRLPFAPGNIIFLQTFLLCAAGVFLAFRIFRTTLQAVAASGVYLVLLAVSPSISGSLAVHWRDPLTAAFFCLAVAFWVGPPGRPPWPGLLLGALAASVCLALRYNAFPILVPITLLMVFRIWRYGPYGGAGLAALLVLLAPYPLAMASVTWRLPDFQRMPPVSSLSKNRIFDIVGVGVCSGRSVLPAAAESEALVPVADLRKVYTPTHVNIVVSGLKARGYSPKTLSDMTLRAAWFDAVSHDPVCFLSHRRLVLMAQIGAVQGNPFYIIHSEIDPNDFGFRLARPEKATAYVAVVSRMAQAYWNRPVVLLLLSIVLMAMTFRAAPEKRLLKLALALGATGFTGLLFLVAPAADARYIVPALVATALLVAISTADLRPFRPRDD